MKTQKPFDADDLNLIKLAREYSDDDKARALLEQLRWPHGPVCPHCKNHTDKPIYKLEPKAGSKSAVRKGVYKCGSCRKQFTVTVKTIFEDSHIKIGTWLMAIFILCSSKKAISAHQLHRMLDITYKSAWFMAHRIRFAMTQGPMMELLKGTLEIDETYVGGKPRVGDKKPEHRGGYRKNSVKTPVVALVKRDGEVRTKVVANVTQKNLWQFIDSNIAKGSIVNTDQSGLYNTILWPIISPKGGNHHVVNHSIGEYARPEKDGIAHVNTAESFFSLLKRGVYGSWHHVSKEHLFRYCDEFAFRWNTRKDTDGKRMAKAVALVTDKRLTYKQAV